MSKRRRKKRKGQTKKIENMVAIRKRQEANRSSELSVQEQISVGTIMLIWRPTYRAYRSYVENTSSRYQSAIRSTDNNIPKIKQRQNTGRYRICCRAGLPLEELNEILPDGRTG